MGESIWRIYGKSLGESILSIYLGQPRAVAIKIGDLTPSFSYCCHVLGALWRVSSWVFVMVFDRDIIGISMLYQEFWKRQYITCLS